MKYIFCPIYITFLNTSHYYVLKHLVLPVDGSTKPPPKLQLTQASIGNPASVCLDLT